MVSAGAVSVRSSGPVGPEAPETLPHRIKASRIDRGMYVLGQLGAAALLIFVLTV